MRSFFIDLENVRSYGLEGILLLKPDDKVYVFYSDNANTLTIPTIESLNESSATVKYIKTNYIGANAMDFQIVTLLGASIEKEQKGSFYIISHDNGFKSAVKFCDGYFTGYDIVTGVFANILLALNSEKNGNSAAKKNKSEGLKPDNEAKNEQATGNASENAERESSGGRNRRRRGRGQKSGRNQENVISGQDTVLADKNTVMVSDPSEADKDEFVDAIDEKKSLPEDKPVIQNEADATEADNKKSRNRNRRRRGRNHDKTVNESANTVSANDEADEPSGINDAEDGFMIIQATSEQKTEHSSHGRNKKKQAKPQKDSGDDPAEVKDNASAPIKYSGNYKYVYNALSDFLSKTTIDMYAAKIDEGIKQSTNRNELHAFFKKSYGQDEAEALYKIIVSDFDKMKKEAGK